MMTKTTGNAEVYEAITNRMIKALESGTVPWQKPWRAATGGRPRSMSTRKPYEGINTLLLAITVMETGYPSPWWGTYNQVAELSGMERRTSTRTGHQYWASPGGTPRGVRKGEHGTQVVLWKTAQRTETDPETGKHATKSYPLARLFTVFNAEQCEGLPDQFYPAKTGEWADESREPEEVLAGYLNAAGPRIRWLAQDRAYYRPGDDLITLPERSQFTTPEAYYGTAFHEAVHSTGHKDRLAREGIEKFDHFGSDRYGREELVAQMGSAILQAETGIETDAEFERSAAYLASWLDAIKADARLVPQAAAQAQRAVTLIAEPERQAEPQPERQAEPVAEADAQAEPEAA